MLLDIVVDGVELERGEWAQDHVDIVAFDELLRLGLGASWTAACIGDDQFDLAASHGVAGLL